MNWGALIVLFGILGIAGFMWWRFFREEALTQNPVIPPQRYKKGRR